MRAWCIAPGWRDANWQTGAVSDGDFWFVVSHGGVWESVSWFRAQKGETWYIFLRFGFCSLVYRVYTGAILRRNYQIIKTGLLVPPQKRSLCEREFHALAAVFSRKQYNENGTWWVPESLFFRIMWNSFPFMQFTHTWRFNLLSHMCINFYLHSEEFHFHWLFQV